MEQIGQDLIDIIVDRTRDGKDIDGKTFKNKYDDDYVASDEFKAFGKSKNDVNMTLEGNMLADIQVLEITDRDIIIGHEDETETAKSYNHNVGDTLPKRAFFGVTDSEIEGVLATYQNEISVSEEQNKESDSSNTITDLLLARAISAERRVALNQSTAANLFDEIFGNDPFEGF